MATVQAWSVVYLPAVEELVWLQLVSVNARVTAAVRGISEVRMQGIYPTNATGFGAWLSLVAQVQSVQGLGWGLRRRWLVTWV